MTMILSRRTFAAGAALLPLAAGALAKAPLQGSGSTPLAADPLVKNRADAQIFLHEDGFYYLTGSVPEYDRVVLRRARTLEGLTDAEERTLWRHEESGPLSGFIWAPEVHEIDGRWYAYFAAGPSGGGEDVFRIRTHVLICNGADPMRGDWTVLGEFKTPWDSFNLDSTIFMHRGTRYFCWAQREPGIETNSNLYIAPLATPQTLGAAPIRLTVPTLDWEIRGFKVNEAPAFLERNGRMFISYSASATDDRYCLGLLSADADADPMHFGNWTKAEEPVFRSDVSTSVYGPGHNSFTVDERGRPILVYHGRDYREIEGDPLFNPDRHTRIQRLYFDPDGMPDFGVPVGNGPLPERFAPVARPGVWLGHQAEVPAVEQLPLAQTQIRCLDAGSDTVRLSPILRRDHCFSVGKDGASSLLPIEESNGNNRTSQFRRVGLGRDEVRFDLASAPGMALALTERGLAIAPSDDRRTHWSVD